MLPTCLPVIISGTLFGVTCVDIPLDTLFSEILYFRQQTLSYAFLVDGQGHVLMHPLIPLPKTELDEPILVDMRSVETEKELLPVRHAMIKFVFIAHFNEFLVLRVPKCNFLGLVENVRFDYRQQLVFSCEQ